MHTHTRAGHPEPLAPSGNVKYTSARRKYLMRAILVFSASKFIYRFSYPGTGAA